MSENPRRRPRRKSAAAAKTAALKARAEKTAAAAPTAAPPLPDTPRALGDAVMARAAAVMRSILSAAPADGLAAGEKAAIAAVKSYVEIARGLAALQRELEPDLAPLLRSAAEMMEPARRAEFGRRLQEALRSDPEQADEGA